jgi:hypothetical protein
MDPATPTVWSLNQRSASDRHDHVRRWEPWVRSMLCGQALNSHLDFDVKFGAKPSTGNTTDVPLSVTLTTSLPGNGARHPLVTLKRPPETVFHEQVKKVLAWADLREERIPEVLTQIANTYAFWGSLIPLHTERMRQTRELLGAAVQLAMFVEMRFKHELACWRPMDYCPQVQPMVTTPGHGSLPSGHCTEAYVIKEVLQSLLGITNPPNLLQSQLHRQFENTAARIATNRVVAGVHFPVDNLAGRLLGTVLGRYFVLCCGRAPGNAKDFVGPTRIFTGDTCPANVEFLPDEQDLDGQDNIYASGEGTLPAELTIQLSLLTELWDAALNELTALQLPFNTSA